MINAGSWSFEDEDEALTFYEDKLFEIKQHLQQKPLLQATIKSRIVQLNQLVILEDLLAISRLHISQEFPDLSLGTANEQWTNYSAVFSKWKLNIFQTESAKDLLELIPQGFHFMKQFCGLLPDFELEEDPKIGVAENVMHLQAGFFWMKQAGIETFSDLGSQIVDRIPENESIKLFAMELKRLSLRLPYL